MGVPCLLRPRSPLLRKVGRGSRTVPSSLAVALTAWHPHLPHSRPATPTSRWSWSSPHIHVMIAAPAAPSGLVAAKSRRQAPFAPWSAAAHWLDPAPSVKPCPRLLRCSLEGGLPRNVAPRNLIWPVDCCISPPIITVSLFRPLCRAPLRRSRRRT